MGFLVSIRLLCGVRSEDNRWFGPNVTEEIFIFFWLFFGLPYIVSNFLRFCIFRFDIYLYFTQTLRQFKIRFSILNYASVYSERRNTKFKLDKQSRPADICQEIVSTWKVLFIFFYEIYIFVYCAYLTFLHVMFLKLNKDLFCTVIIILFPIFHNFVTKILILFIKLNLISDI